MFVHGKYFYGNEISEYGQKNGYVDYRTLAKAFDAVLNNDIMTQTEGVIGFWEQESGFVDNSEKIDEIREKIDELETKLHETDDDDEIDRIGDEIRDAENDIEDLESEQDEIPDVFQWYIVDNRGAEILDEAGEIVYYNSALDMYLWGVTHYGTAWDYVLTNIACNVPYADEANA